MANEPGPAAEKRTPPKDRRNAQGDHEGSPHRPEEFDQANPAKQVPQPKTRPEEFDQANPAKQVPQPKTRPEE